MGSSVSGLYSETRGARAIACTPRAMHMQVSFWAEAEKERLGKISARKQDKFNTASVAYDIKSGKYYYGRNNGIEQDKEPQNPAIFGLSGVLPSKTLNGYDLGNCAEVQAINKALNSGAKMENLYIFTIHTTPKSFGQPKPACKNCTFAFKGKVKKNHTGWIE